ncbi:MAG: hypothetical protein VX470_10910, partial [Planctomycetota bacterium]|nr:hypothetical protein [Planctomycetota bacterium]
TVSRPDVIPGYRDPMSVTVGLGHWRHFTPKFAPNDGLCSLKANPWNAQKKQSSSFGAVKQEVRSSTTDQEFAEEVG